MRAQAQTALNEPNQTQERFKALHMRGNTGKERFLNRRQSNFGISATRRASVARHARRNSALELTQQSGDQLDEMFLAMSKQPSRAGSARDRRQRVEQATVLLLDAMHDRDISHLLDTVSLKLYYIVYNIWWRRLVTIIILGQLSLACFEHPSVLGFPLPKLPLLLMDTFFLLVQAVDLVFKFKMAVSCHYQDSPWLWLKAVVWFLLSLDVMLAISRPNDSARFFRLFRPVFLVEHVASLRAIAEHMVAAVRALARLFFIFLVVLAFFAFTAILLFPVTSAEGQTHFNSLHTTLQTLSYLTLGSVNFPDAMLPAYITQSKGLAMFFLLYLFVTIVFVLNLWLSAVYDAYKTSIETSVMDVYTRRCVALATAFSLLNTDSGVNGELHKRDLEQALRTARIVGMHGITFGEIRNVCCCSRRTKHHRLTSGMYPDDNSTSGYAESKGEVESPQAASAAPIPSDSAAAGETSAAGGASDGNAAAGSGGPAISAAAASSDQTARNDAWWAQEFEALWECLDQDCSDSVSMLEFLRIKEVLHLRFESRQQAYPLWLRRFYRPLPSHNWFRRLWVGGLFPALRPLVLSTPFQALIIVAISLQLADLAWSAKELIQSRPPLPVAIETSLLGLYAIEMVIKMLAVGVRGYFSSVWWCFDFACVVLPSLALVSEGSSTFQAMRTTSAWLRLVSCARALQVFRLLLRVREFRIILSFWISLLPLMVNFGVILLCMFYFYSIIGMAMFHASLVPSNPLLAGTAYAAAGFSYSKFNATANATQTLFVHSYVVGVSYSNIATSFLVMFDLLFLNNWNIIHEASIAVLGKRGRYWVTLYYTSFIILAVILCLNLLVAFFLEQYGCRMAQLEEVRQTCDGDWGDDAFEDCVPPLGSNSDGNGADAAAAPPPLWMRVLGVSSPQDAPVRVSVDPGVDTHAGTDTDTDADTDTGTGTDTDTDTDPGTDSGGAQRKSGGNWLRRIVARRKRNRYDGSDDDGTPSVHQSAMQESLQRVLLNGRELGHAKRRANQECRSHSFLRNRLKLLQMLQHQQYQEGKQTESKRSRRNQQCDSTRDARTLFARQDEAHRLERQLRLCHDTTMHSKWFALPKRCFICNQLSCANCCKSELLPDRDVLGRVVDGSWPRLGFEPVPVCRICHYLELRRMGAAAPERTDSTCCCCTPASPLRQGAQQQRSRMPSRATSSGGAGMLLPSNRFTLKRANELMVGDKLAAFQLSQEQRIRGALEEAEKKEEEAQKKGAEKGEEAQKQGAQKEEEAITAAPVPTVTALHPLPSAASAGGGATSTASRLPRRSVGGCAQLAALHEDPGEHGGIELLVIAEEEEEAPQASSAGGD